MSLLLPGEMKPQWPSFSGVAAVSVRPTFFFFSTPQEPDIFLQAGLGRGQGWPFPMSKTFLPFPICLLFGGFSHLCHLAWHGAHLVPLTETPGKQADGVGTRAGAWQLSTSGHSVSLSERGDFIYLLQIGSIMEKPRTYFFWNESIVICFTKGFLTFPLSSSSPNTF